MNFEWAVICNASLGISPKPVHALSSHARTAYGVSKFSRLAARVFTYGDAFPLAASYTHLPNHWSSMVAHVLTAIALTVILRVGFARQSAVRPSQQGKLPPQA